MSLKEAILGLLYDSPRTGYEIKRFYTETVRNFWNISDGQLYPTLRKMHDEGLVHKKVIPQTKTANKNLFSITSEGKKKFLNWLKEPVLKFQEMREPLLIKMFFFDKLTKDDIAMHLKAQMAVNKHMLEELHEVEEIYEEEFTEYRKLISEAGIFFLELRVLWISRMMDLLEKNKIDGKHKLIPGRRRQLIPAFFECLFAEKPDSEIKEIIDKLKARAGGRPRKKGRKRNE